MTKPATPKSPSPNSHELLARVAQAIEQNPFRPHPLFPGGHAQTLAAYAWPRRYKLIRTNDEERLFEVANEVQVLAHCRWQADKQNSPTILLWHGIEGSSSSVYMLAMAEKGFAAGFNIVRMNLRNCGGTEHLTPTLYHGGLSEDLRSVVTELVEGDRLEKLVLVGFSLGGNMVLKLAAEYGNEHPREVLGICAVSPSVDLSASSNMIGLRSNWLYHRDFVRRLKRRIQIKHKLYPELYDTTQLQQVRTLRDFDSRYTALLHGFKDVDDYYRRASSVTLLDRIQLPTLIIHAEDDPFIPFAPLRTSAAVSNPAILLMGTKRGGHVAFLSARSRNQNFASGLNEDRFWAENRALDFCRLVVNG